MKKSEPASDLVRYLKLIQEPGKLELLVLRAHMLFEEQLRALIDEYLPVPNNFRHEIFGFSQCLSLVKAIYWKPSNEWIWECVTLLNSVRNAMAHKLKTHDDESVKEKLNRIDLLVKKNSHVPIPSKLEPSVQRMQWQLASLYATINKLPQEASQ